MCIVSTFVQIVLFWKIIISWKRKTQRSNKPLVPTNSHLPQRWDIFTSIKQLLSYSLVITDEFNDIPVLCYNVTFKLLHEFIFKKHFAWFSVKQGWARLKMIWCMCIVSTFVQIVLGVKKKNYTFDRE